MYLSNNDSGRKAHDNIHELSTFLADIEKRAFRIAQLAVGNIEDALDIVQDAMLSLSQHYANRNPVEWKPLFYRILENRIMDFHRKETLRKKWFWWKPEPETQAEPLEWAQKGDGNQPLETLQQDQLSKDLLTVISKLPFKQQQCFLLRSWEGLSVRETAAAMGVKEGSVKTHFYRAMQKLQTVLESHEKE